MRSNLTANMDTSLQYAANIDSYLTSLAEE